MAVTETSGVPPATKEVIAIIKPAHGWIAVDFRELWDYRELMYFFARRDISIRYKQTLLGVAWALIQPVVSMVIFTVFFGKLAKLPSDGIPYPIFSYVALLPWQYFSTVLSSGSTSVVSNSNMISKVFFPRLIIPMAALIPPLFDFAIAFVILIGLMFYYGISPTWNILWLPLFLLLAMCTGLGFALWLSAMNVRYRDVRYVIPYVVQAWQFASPVVYSSTMIPDNLRALYGLNPMAGVIDGFRWALLGTHTSPGPIILVSALISLVILVSGMFYFQRTEKTFADLI